VPAPQSYPNPPPFSTPKAHPQNARRPRNGHVGKPHRELAQLRHVTVAGRGPTRLSACSDALARACANQAQGAPELTRIDGVEPHILALPEPRDLLADPAR
jgi:hypothetical protein